MIRHCLAILLKRDCLLHAVWNSNAAIQVVVAAGPKQTTEDPMQQAMRSIRSDGADQKPPRPRPEPEFVTIPTPQLIGWRFVSLADRVIPISKDVFSPLDEQIPIVLCGRQ
jgi:hypothetical protein